MQKGYEYKRLELKEEINTKNCWSSKKTITLPILKVIMLQRFPFLPETKTSNCNCCQIVVESFKFISYHSSFDLCGTLIDLPHQVSKYFSAPPLPFSIRLLQHFLQLVLPDIRYTRYQFEEFTVLVIMEGYVILPVLL